VDCVFEPDAVTQINLGFLFEMAPKIVIPTPLLGVSFKEYGLSVLSQTLFYFSL
jgi:hypothetical protein